MKPRARRARLPSPTQHVKTVTSAARRYRRPYSCRDSRDRFPADRCWVRAEFTRRRGLLQPFASLTYGFRRNIPVNERTRAFWARGTKIREGAPAGEGTREETPARGHLRGRARAGEG